MVPRFDLFARPAVARFCVARPAFLVPRFDLFARPAVARFCVARPATLVLRPDLFAGDLRAAAFEARSSLRAAFSASPAAFLAASLRAGLAALAFFTDFAIRARELSSRASSAAIFLSVFLRILASPPISATASSRWRDPASFLARASLSCALPSSLCTLSTRARPWYSWTSIAAIFSLPADMRRSADASAALARLSDSAALW